MQSEQLLMFSAVVLGVLGLVIAILATKLLDVDLKQPAVRRLLAQGTSPKVGLSDNLADRLSGSTLYPRSNVADDLNAFPRDSLDGGLADWEDEGGSVARHITRSGYI